jgi:hypothetical protein
MGRRREQAKGESGGDGCPTQVLITRNSLPVRAGLVVSLARPGGNATRASLMGGALGVKRVGLLRELVPDATAFALLANPNNSNSRPDVSDVETAVRTAGLRPIILQASTTAELDAAFAKLLKERAKAAAGDMQREKGGRGRTWLCSRDRSIAESADGVPGRSAVDQYSRGVILANRAPRRL